VRTVRLGFPGLVVLGVLSYGLLGPVVAAGHLHDEANAAAQAGYARLLSSNSSSASVQQSVAGSVAHHSNVQVKSVKIQGGVVTVVLEEKVHSFMSGVPGLKGWFTVSATESASATG
jgi:hypothetical protein